MENKKIAISLENINFGYDYNKKDLIIDNLSLDIECGSFFCLTGESGCGKSTLLRIINGLLTPQSGTVKIYNTILSPDNIINIRRDMGYILQGNSLFPHYTAYQNMTYCLDLENKDPEKSRQRIEELLPIVHLDPEVLDKFPSELSGGQRQRVGIIRGIAHQPRIILMDEPFSALDPETRSSLQDLVKDIHQETHTTLVMVTHSMSEAEKLGTRIYKM